MKNNLTIDILKKNHFEREDTIEERNLYNTEDFYIDNYSRWSYYLQNDNIPMHIQITYGLTNIKTWHVHIDNNSCQTIGCLDFDTIEEFNFFMRAFGNKFTLHI